MKKLLIIVLGFIAALSFLYLMTRLVVAPDSDSVEDAAEMCEPEFEVIPDLESESVPNEQVVVAPSIVPAISPDSSPIQVVDNQLNDIAPINLHTEGFAAFDTNVHQGWHIINDGSGLQDRQAIALFQSTPRYPIVAQTEGIEGWVKLRYDVSPSGLAVNIKVVEAKPRRVFDSEAKKALKRWKFKAEQIDGKAVTLKNQSVVMEFNLSDN